MFTEHPVESNRDLWMAMAGHPFVLGLADGTLPDGALQAWVQQDRISVGEERRAVAAPAPTACRRGWARCSPTRLPALTLPASVGADGQRLTSAVLSELVQVDVVALAVQAARPPDPAADVQVQGGDQDRADHEGVQQHPEGDREADLGDEHQRQRPQRGEGPGQHDPAEVITPPVAARPISAPRRVP